jgi:DNA-binding IclR family transcriptional regulator
MRLIDSRESIDKSWLRATTVAAKNYISLIEKTVRVLEAFEGSRRLPLREIAESTGLVKSSTFRILFTLQKLGYVERTSKGRYALTGRLREVSNDPRVWALLMDRTKPVVASLVSRFQETVNVGVLDGPEVSYLCVTESPQAFRFTALAGMRSFVHSTALGKCLVCRFSATELEKIFKRRPLRAMTAKTIRDKTTFYREIENVASRGYAVDNEEDSRGVRCLAAPVLDARGRVVAAVSISAPASRLPPFSDREVATELMKACNKIAISMDC